MNRFALFLLFALFSASSVFGAERVRAKAWRRVKTYDMSALQKIEPLPLRQIVGVRFSYRNRTVRHLKPNWFYSSIWSYRQSGAKADFSHIPVMVALKDLDMFKALPVDFRAGGEFVVYGQVLEDAEAKFLFLRLLGTKVRRDARGNATVGW